jgi:hypothetical protein
MRSKTLMGLDFVSRNGGPSLISSKNISPEPVPLRPPTNGLSAEKMSKGNNDSSVVGINVNNLGGRPLPHRELKSQD